MTIWSYFPFDVNVAQDNYVYSSENSTGRNSIIVLVELYIWSVLVTYIYKQISNYWSAVRVTKVLLTAL